jgi:hypothetical protein
MKQGKNWWIWNWICVGYKLKFIFLTEGKHDGPIISELIINKCKTSNINNFCIFYDNIGKTKTKYNEETKKLKKLLGKNSQYNYLIKYEGGKGDLLKLGQYVIEQIEQILEDLDHEPPGIEIYLMTDCDGIGFSQKFKKISCEISNTYEGIVLQISMDPKTPIFCMNKSFARYTITIATPSDTSFRYLKVHFLFVDPTLESVVSKAQKIQKNKVNEQAVRQFARNNIQDLTSLIF